MERDKYRISVDITKGDWRAEVLKQIAGNLQICTDSLEIATDRVSKLLIMFDMVKEGQFDCYGAIILMDEENAEVVDTWAIRGGNNEQRFDEIAGSYNPWDFSELVLKK